MTSHLGLMLIFSLFVSDGVCRAHARRSEGADHVRCTSVRRVRRRRHPDRLAAVSASSLAAGVRLHSSRARPPLAVGACRRVHGWRSSSSRACRSRRCRNEVSDKTGHFAAYAGLAMLCRARRRRRPAVSRGAPCGAACAARSQPATARSTKSISLRAGAIRRCRTTGSRTSAGASSASARAGCGVSLRFALMFERLDPPASDPDVHRMPTL